MCPDVGSQQAAAGPGPEQHHITDVISHMIRFLKSAVFGLGKEALWHADTHCAATKSVQLGTSLTSTEELGRLLGVDAALRHCCCVPLLWAPAGGEKEERNGAVSNPAGSGTKATFSQSVSHSQETVCVHSLLQRQPACCAVADALLNRSCRTTLCRTTLCKGALLRLRGGGGCAGMRPPERVAGPLPCMLQRAACSWHTR